MKIAFDLDDTLIPTSQEFMVGSSKLGFPASLFFKEKLRNGAVNLMNELAEENEVWIYTTSQRSVLGLHIWFKLWGVKVAGVINNKVHSNAVANTKYSGFSKAPKLFGISVMVDDLLGVKIECDQQFCKSIIIEPTDKNWVKSVRDSLKSSKLVKKTAYTRC